MMIEQRPSPLLPNSSRALFKWTFQEPDESATEDGELPLQADRPDFTEASAAVGLGRVQLESGYTFTTNRQSGLRSNLSTYPEIILRIGLFADWFELRLGWNYNNLRLKDQLDFESLRATGSDDLYLGFKLALTEQAGLFPEMAINVQTTAPTGARSFSAQRWLPGINWLYGWDLTEGLTFAGSTSFDSAQDDLGQVYVTIGQALTVGWDWTESLGSYSEVYALLPHGALSSSIKPQYYYNAGFVYKWSKDFHTDIRAGMGLNRAADDFFTGAGFVYRY